MKETFETNLANSQKEEMQSQKDYEDLKAAKEAEIKAGQDLIDTKTVELGTTDEKNAQSKKNLEDTRETLAFLSSDEAHDLFTRTFNFVQVRVSIKSHKRAQVSSVLSQAAQKFQDPRLSTLAVQARLDAFTKVKKSIQDMVDKLIKEKEDEIKHKDFCVEELNNNERDTEMKERDRADLEAKI